MAIYKGQLMNQETKDILYPQTSTDMVDGLKELLEQGVMVADTLPIGSVIGWDSEKPYPSDIYEEVTYNPRQLLVNPDFQVNQRGQTSYMNNTSTPKYTLDMWQLAYGTINVLDNGIKIIPYATQAFLNQKISDDLTDKQVTLVLKETNGEMHILQGVASKTQALSSKSGNVTLSIGYISETNLYKIGTTYDAETFVEYINLFDGDIVYPHVKNKYAYDLMECQRYSKYYNQLNFAITYDYTGGRYIAICNIPKMDSIPSFTHGKAVVWDNTGSRSEVTVVYKNAHVTWVEITFQSDIIMNTGNTTVLLNNIVLSCEPL